MSEKIDIAALKRDTNIEEVIGRFLTLKPKAPHFVACCPFHGDDTASFTVTPKKRMWKCFGCGEGGDVIDFLVKMGKTFPEALQYLSDPNNTAAVQYTGPQRDSFKLQERIIWKNVVPAIPGNESMFQHYKLGMPSMKWPYYDAKGQLVGYVCRFELPKGKKELMPLSYATDGNRHAWIYQGFDKPRPIGNAHKIAKDDNCTILIVEGEKTGAAAEKLFIRYIPTWWPGGSSSAKFADWSILKGKTVLLWPDNDGPGFKVMHEIYEIIKPFCPDVKWIMPPADAEKGWDVADAKWTTPEANKFVDDNTHKYNPDFTWVDPETKEIEQLTDNTIVKVNNPPPPQLPPNDDENAPYPLKGTQYFRILGIFKEGNGMIYNFYSYASKTVITLAPSSMTKNNILQLAPFDWWKNEFGDSKGSISVEKASDYLIQKSSEIGVFSSRSVRGRGAWVDNKSVVVHAGDVLYVDGKQVQLRDHASRYIYEMGDRLNFSLEKPLKNSQAFKLLEMAKMLNWESPISAYKLVGWCVVAPICGALTWRPHIWVVGASGTGKTWIFKNIVQRLVGGISHLVEGETSEAGLRQLLKNDAMPVVFDEAESEDRRSQERMQSVLTLVRASSSNDGGEMVKGSSQGGVVKYRIRSCFAFASIIEQMIQTSDRSRISVLRLRYANGPNAATKYQEFLKVYNKLITDDYCSSLRARTIDLLPIILKNAKTFSTAAASVLGAQRTGDQVGVLLAGAYSLISDKVITYEKAVEWVTKQDWTEERANETLRDEIRLLSHLMQQMVRVEADYKIVDRSIGELALLAFKLKTDGNVSEDNANDRLKRCGMKISGDHMYFAATDNQILRLLENTPFANNHITVLRRVEGAEDVETTRFASGLRSRAVRIHKDILFKDMEPEPQKEEKKKAPDKMFQAILDTDSEYNYQTD